MNSNSNLSKYPESPGRSKNFADTVARRFTSELSSFVDSDVYRIACF